MAKAAAQQQLTETLTGAVGHIQAGRLDAAIKTLEANGGLALKNPVGRNILGDIYLKQGKPREALKAFDQALKLAPQFPEAHCNRVVALQELGRLEEALKAADRALKLRPDYATAHYNRGNVLKDLGRPDAAIAAFDRALKARPAFAEAHLNRGAALVGQTRLVEALAAFRRARALNPELVSAYLGEARTLGELRQFGEAMAAVGAATALEPDNREAGIVRARVLLQAELPGDALALVDASIARWPDDAKYRATRATVLNELGRHDEALADADEAVRLAPSDPDNHTVRALALSELGRVEEQVAELDTAQRLGAASANYFHGRAIALSDFGDLGDAAAAYEKAIAMDPHAPKVHYHYGMLLLATGDFARGWAEHEWRLRDHTYKNRAPSVAPLWRGEPLQGKKVLVSSEQGHGDNIQFARFIPKIAAMGADVTLTVPRALAALMRRALPGIDVADGLGVRRGFDYEIPAMTLPFALGTNLETIPGEEAFLTAAAERVEKWRMRLGGEGFKVGLAWQGNPEYYRDRFRSIPLKRFQPLAEVPGVRLISIQAINGLDQLNALPEGMRVESFGDEIGRNPDGFEEVAGLMANLDLIVSSDTVSVHLAGALGRPVWVALSYRPDWRWMQGRTDSPWYPTMRLFRQASHNDWEPVIAEIAAALGETIAGA